MSYNAENYRRIRTEYENKYARARASADARREELHVAIPELVAIDNELEQTGLNVMRAFLAGSGDVAANVENIRTRNVALQKKRSDLLASNGYPEDYSDVKYECEKCSDTGFVDGKMCSCMRKQLVMAGCESSGLGMLLREQSFDNFSLEYYKSNSDEYREMQKNFQFAYDFSTGFCVPGSDSLLLMGGTGLGKTHLSSAVAGMLISNGFDVFYTGIQGMISDFEHERFGNSSTPESGARPDKYTDCDLLILDDLGTEVTNQFTLSCLFNVINTRLNLRRPTVISTNLNGNELRSRYTDRIVSRLFGEYRVLRFVGRDIRAQKLGKM